MVKAPPQAPLADALASPSAMHDGVGLADHEPDGKGASQQKPPTAAQEITRRDVHTASSISAQRRLAKSSATRDPTPVQQAAIRRSKTEGSSQTLSPQSQNTAPSKPVLVRGPSTKPDMKKKQQPVDRSTSPRLPPVESFSFQDILDSIGQDANASIDAIAEICGRSKMSLAAEHNSHRPPQGQLGPIGNNSDSSFSPARLEPVAETRSSRPHTRSMSRSLALATGSAQSGDGLPDNPTAATSNVTSHTHTGTSGHGKGEDVPATTSSSLLPQVLAWLRRAGPTTTNEQANQYQDAGAVSVMHRLLNDTPEARL